MPNGDGQRDCMSSTVKQCPQAEETSLLGKLLPLGLRMVDIRADGHCMYRALEDQLTQKAGEGKKAAHTYQQLRELAAEHIR